MTRAFPAFLAACLALAAIAPAAARGLGEDLRALPSSQRVLLIEREYASQSGGRTIPDDQLAYYLDRVEDGWGMPEVRGDISGSLRGRDGRRWSGSSWSGATLVCSSNDRRRRECRTPFKGRPVLVENISGTRCIEGRNFGGGGGTMWVDDGCRGRFAEGRGGWSGGNGELVRCESRDNRRQTCAIRGRAVLVRQLSRTACVEGRTWGQRGDTLWVDDGCRAEFTTGHGPAPGHRPGPGPGRDYSVTCSSDNKRRRTCDWDRRQGRPVVVQQISSTRCEENRNWGWSGGSIWVDGGCRARFGVR